MVTSESLKVPPHDIDAEKSVLGALLIDSSAINLVAEFLRAEHFYIPEHQAIYSAMLTLFEKQQPIDVVTLQDQLKHEGTLKKIGGQSYLSDLINIVPTSAYVEHYANIVKSQYAKRKLIELSSRMVEKAFAEKGDVKKLLDEAEVEIFSLAQQHLHQDFIELKEILAESFERLEEFVKKGTHLRGVPTGFTDLDNKLAGMQDSNLLILAARPGIGKTTLALNMALSVATKNKLPVGFFSLEMSKEELVDRLLVGQADIDAWRLKTGKLSDDDYKKLTEAMGELSEAPIYIDDTPGASILEMRTKARKIKVEKNIKFIIVDYLQLANAGRQYDNRVQEVSIISQGLKNLARELRIPVLAISQLSRAVEQRGSKKPQLSDLRESGCLSGDTLIMCADTGKLMKIEDLAKRDVQTSIPVYSLDNNWKLSIRKMVKAFSSGRKRIFELKTQSGRTIKASANHPFRTLKRWKRLDQLKTGDRIVVVEIEDLMSFCHSRSGDSVRINQKSSSQSKNCHCQSSNCICQLETNHNSSDNLVNRKLKNQQNIVNVTPNPTINTIPLSTEEMSGETTIIPKNTWPALSKTLANRRQTSLVNIKSNVSDSQDRVNGLYWDRIVAIDQLGIEEVYDATVEETHNFVANDIIVHNSIEQDADVVMFLYYEDDSEDLLDQSKRLIKLYIAKHRNGPTGEIDLMFRGDRVKFYGVEK